LDAGREHSPGAPRDGVRMVIREDEGLTGACALRRRCGLRCGVWLAPAGARLRRPRPHREDSRSALGA